MKTLPRAQGRHCTAICLCLVRENSKVTQRGGRGGEPITTAGPVAVNSCGSGLLEAQLPSSTSIFLGFLALCKLGQILGQLAPATADIRCSPMCSGGKWKLRPAGAVHLVGLCENVGSCAAKQDPTSTSSADGAAMSSCHHPRYTRERQVR